MLHKISSFELWVDFQQTMEINLSYVDTVDGWNVEILYFFEKLVIHDPISPLTTSWNPTNDPFEKETSSSKSSIFKGFLMSFVPELYNTSQESPKLSAIHGIGRWVSSLPGQALTSSA